MTASECFFFNTFIKDLAEKKHDLSTDELKVTFTNTAPDFALDQVLGDIEEIDETGGFVAGGYTIQNISTILDGAVYKVFGDDINLTVSSGGMGPLQYAVVYNNTGATKRLICCYDYGVSKLIDVDTRFVVNFAGVNGVFKIGAQQ